MLLKDLRDYREFAFPSVLSDKLSNNYLALTSAHEWANPEAVKAFLHARPNFNKADTGATDLWETASLEILTGYLDWLFPESLAARQRFDLENIEVWFLDMPFRLFLSLMPTPHSLSNIMHSTNAFKSSPHVGRTPKTEVHCNDPIILGKRKANSPLLQDIIELSDDDDSQTSARSNVQKSHKKPRRDNKNPSFIDLTCDLGGMTSSDASDTETIVHAPPKRTTKGKCVRKHNPDSQIKITASEYVAEVVQLDTLPTSWDPSEAPKAYVVDLSKRPMVLEGGKKNITGLIRGDDQCSWDGSSGHRRGDVFVYNTFPGREKEFCQRAVLKCRSIKICEFFDHKRLHGYESFEKGDDEMQEFWVGELDANEQESMIPDGPEARFYNRILASKCKMKECTGKPRLVDLRYSTTFGKNIRIGCTGWRPGDAAGTHRWIDLDRNINETQFIAIFKSGGRFKENLTINGKCSVTVPFRSHKTICPFSHIIDGEIKSGKIAPYKEPCTSTLLIFQPVDPALSHMAVVIPKYPHNHPRQAHVKPTLSEKQFINHVFKAAGKTRVTPKALQRSSTTTTLLDGQSWGTRVPGMADNKRLSKHLDRLKKDGYPAGMEFQGVQYEANFREALLPADQRYIHSVITRGEIQLVVTMLPQLVKHIHSVRYLAIDYTFKRVRGAMNEWEVAAFLDRYHSRVSLASLYCNKFTREAFTLLFQEFFDTVHRVTGKPLQLAAFVKDARLQCLLFDAEPPQMQACGDVMLTMNDPATSGIETKDPLILVQHVAKTCLQHFLRNIDKLPINISRQDIDRLKAFPGLVTQEAIDVWHEFCRNSQHKSIRDWHKQKLDHPWYLPSLNSFLSPMDPTSWKLTPNDTNIVETAHAARNAETGIGASLLSAILDARSRDQVIALRFDENERTPGGLANRWNGASARENRSAARRVATRTKATTVHDNRDQLRGLEDERAQLADNRAQSLDHKKEIEERLGEITVELRNHTKVSAAGVALRQERTNLQEEKKEGVSQRKVWSARVDELEKEIKYIKTTDLKGVRARDSRPPSTPRRDDGMLPSLPSTPRTPSRSQLLAESQLPNSTPVRHTPLRHEHHDELAQHGALSDLDIDGDDDDSAIIHPLRFTPARSPQSDVNMPLALDNLAGDPQAAIDTNLLDNPGFVDGLLAWQPTYDELLEVSDRFREFFPDGLD
ncbi:hypothetical protein D9615_003872 [Tricholomella constricta]|uniref:Uncharacterized protein n=1 Tax=Tricholomella constricta TaxID=117010 RepID=A0A8H5HD61_9AGAR|nr:hypothetical protein D9615_003872 [Tricholomella constricta]